MASSTKPKSGFRSVRSKSGSKESVSPNAAATSTTPKPSKLSKESSGSKSKGNVMNYRDRNSRRKPSQSVMVRLKRLDTLRLNQRIKVRDYGYGTIRFLGCVHFAQGLFVGVELDEAMGKHDGSYHNKRYFTAKEKHGVLVKQHRVELLDILDPTMSPDLTAGDGVRKNRGSMHLNLDEEFSSMERRDEEHDEAEEAETERARGSKLGVVKELMVRNQRMTEELDALRADVEGKEAKIGSLEAENGALRAEKREFEEEMTTKIEELEDRLQRITEQLTTKGEVLQKQIALHEKTKAKFKRKVNEFDELKTKNQDTVQLILYGDNLKDDIIGELKRSEKRHRDEKQECFLEVDRIKSQSEERLHKQLEQWLFDYGDVQ